MNTVDLLGRMIAIDTTSARSNLPLVELLEREARALGFQTRRQQWTDAQGVAKANLVATRGAEQPAVALVGHTDCVPFDPAWDGALAAAVRDGNLYGRGSADTKSFIACALGAASRNSLPLQLIFTADEEVGCLGAKRLLDEGRARPRTAVIGEPTKLIPVLGHKGYCLAEITVEGAEGHSAYPDTGASAILAAGRLLGALERIGRELAADADPLFSPPETTLNVGLIQGGKAKNVIAGACTLTLEWRPIPGQDVRRVLGLVEQACAELSTGRIRATVRASRLDAGVSVPRDGKLLRLLAAESGNEPQTIPFGTELPYLVGLGAEACVFGPGDIRVAHRTGEFVPLDDLARAEVALARVIESFQG